MDAVGVITRLGESSFLGAVVGILPSSTFISLWVLYVGSSAVISGEFFFTFWASVAVILCKISNLNINTICSM